MGRIQEVETCAVRRENLKECKWDSATMMHIERTVQNSRTGHLREGKCKKKWGGGGNNDVEKGCFVSKRADTDDLENEEQV